MYNTMCQSYRYFNIKTNSFSFQYLVYLASSHFFIQHIEEFLTAFKYFSYFAYTSIRFSGLSGYKVLSANAISI